MVAITQPRRVAAVTVATRVAEERAVTIGHEVGYAIRFDDCTTDGVTKIKFLTDGLLIREMMADPLLRQYSVIMLDEAHERTLNTDIVVGLLKRVLKKRNDLKLIVASATLDAEAFRDFFNLESNAKSSSTILTVEGRMFPVDIYYSLDPVPNYLKSTVETIVKIHNNESAGDILAFLTGQDEVEHVVSLLIQEAKQLNKSDMKMWVLPMYGSLPASEQMKVFQRISRSTRKIVIATNIAEASITISGVVYIVDCGFVKFRAYNPQSGVETLVVVPVSQASSEQRAGRAGRSRSGKVYRLYTGEYYSTLPRITVPEMQRSDMSSVILQLKALGVDNVLRFSFMAPPPAQNMVRGLEQLYALDALDEKCMLTSPLGFRMAEFPLSPMFAKMLLCSDELGCSQEIVAIAAMMQIQNVFVSPPGQKVAAARAKRKFSVKEGDHLTLLNVFNSFIEHNENTQWCHNNLLNHKGLCRAIEIKDQITRILGRFRIKMVSCNGDVDAILKCITMGFFANAARLHYSGVYKTIREDHELHIHPMSVLYVENAPEYLVFNEVIHTTKEFMRDVTVIKPEWLYQLAPHYYHYGTERELSVKRRKLTD